MAGVNWSNTYNYMQNATTPEFRSGCPLSSWLDFFGDRWTLLVLRDVAYSGKKNFKEFLESDEGIATNILSDRLKHLVSLGLITKTINKNNKSKFDYDATEKGLSLIPIMLNISEWSNQNLTHSHSFELASQADLSNSLSSKG